MKRLNGFISKLEASEDVDAVFITGSAAIGTDTPDSDIDIVIILKSNPHKLRSVYEIIDGKFADIFFFTTSDIETLLNQDGVKANEMLGMLVTWLSKSKIEFDKSAKVTQLKENIDNVSLIVTEEEKFQALQSVSYSWLHNRRYYRSGKKEYIDALEVRLCQSVLEIFTAYCALRGIPWRGEKQVVKLIEESNPALKQAWLDFLVATKVDDRMQAYTHMVAEMMPEGVKLLEYDESVVITNDVAVNKKELQGYWDEISS